MNGTCSFCQQHGPLHLRWKQIDGKKETEYRYLCLRLKCLNKYFTHLRAQRARYELAHQERAERFTLRTNPRG